jgi:hypothetical protein
VIGHRGSNLGSRVFHLSSFLASPCPTGCTSDVASEQQHDEEASTPAGPSAVPNPIAHARSHQQKQRRRDVRAAAPTGLQQPGVEESDDAMSQQEEAEVEGTRQPSITDLASFANTHWTHVLTALEDRSPQEEEPSDSDHEGSGSQGDEQEEEEGEEDTEEEEGDDSRSPCACTINRGSTSRISSINTIEGACSSISAQTWGRCTAPFSILSPYPHPCTRASCTTCYSLQQHAGP